MKTVCAWMVCCVLGVACAGEEASVLVASPAAPTSAKEVIVVSNCNTGCCSGKCNPVYTEKTDEVSTCRRTIFGKVVKRDVKRTVLTPVR